MHFCDGKRDEFQHNLMHFRDGKRNEFQHHLMHFRDGKRDESGPIWFSSQFDAFSWRKTWRISSQFDAFSWRKTWRISSQFDAFSWRKRNEFQHHLMHFRDGKRLNSIKRYTFEQKFEKFQKNVTLLDKNLKNFKKTLRILTYFTIKTLRFLGYFPILIEFFHLSKIHFESLMMVRSRKLSYVGLS